MQCVGFAREREARGQRDAVRLLDFLRDGVVICGIGDHRDAFEIFRGGAQHCGAADVNIFDEFFGRDVRFARGGGKGIEIYDDQIDRHDALRRGFVAIAFLSALIKNSAVNFRMQRLHAPAQHFRPVGELGNVAHGHAAFAQHPRRAAGGDDFNFCRGQALREFQQPGFIEYADQRSLNRHESLRI